MGPRCQTAHGCLCPRAVCVSCGMSERVCTTVRGEHTCCGCRAAMKAAARAPSPKSAIHADMEARQTGSSHVASPSNRAGTGELMKNDMLKKFRLLDANQDGTIDQGILLQTLQG